MLAAQARYGAGPARCISAGGAALGLRFTSLLPEDGPDEGPLSGGDGRLLLAADVRIDNRGELIAALGGGGECSDAALLLRAWERWEEEAPGRIAGDFAFALWESERRRLVLARDFLGQRPLFFARGAGFAAFVSMPSGLHALDEVPRAIDPDALRAFAALAPERGGASFFRGVERVEPGCLVAIGPEGTRARRFWNPSLAPMRLRDPREYVEGVRERLDEAVCARLRRREGRLGAHLSGGLDSGAVAATAARLGSPLTAFTAAPGEPSGAARPGRFEDEGPLAAATAALYPNVEHLLVRGAGSPLAAIGRGAELFQRPVPNACNSVWGDALLDAAREAGVSVLLTGQAGNFTFSPTGVDALPSLFGGGRLLRFARAAAAMRRNGTSARAIASQTAAPLLPLPLWRAWRRLRRAPMEAAEFSFAAAGDPLIDYSSRPARDGAGARLAALRSLDFGAFNKGILAGWGIDLRDPTGDRRLVEFCLRIPAERFLAGGVPRGLARQALADRLPAAVIEERRRGYQAADWFEGLAADLAGIAREVERIGACPAAADLLDLDRIRAALAALPEADPAAADTERIYRRALLRALSAGQFARRIACPEG